MSRTSITHPISIAEVEAAGGGRVGITFCPGKKQPNGMTGPWDRDVDLDLDAVKAWGASAVVTLVEDHELRSLAVEHLGEAVEARGMRWLHLPIPDQGIPDSKFEYEWNGVQGALHTILDGGGAVVVHCKGGQGRAGTIAARLLIERGSEVDAAIALVRTARRGAIENSVQERYLRVMTPGVRTSGKPEEPEAGR